MSYRSGRLEAGDGTGLYWQAWSPEGKARATVLIVHGMSEHSGRYRPLAEMLASRGLSVEAYDHRGHGLSEGRRGWVARFEDLLDDLELFLARARRAGLPLFVLGHSMGGLIVTAYMLAGRPGPDYLILSGPAIVPLIDGSDRSVDPSRLTKDAEMQKAYMDDPLILRDRVDPELFLRLFEGVVTLPGRAHEIGLPVLLVQGQDDPLCSADGARDYVDGFSTEDKTLRVYAGGRHEMLNETNRVEVMEELCQWVEAHL